MTKQTSDQYENVTVSFDMLYLNCTNNNNPRYDPCMYVKTVLPIWHLSTSTKPHNILRCLISEVYLHNRLVHYACSSRVRTRDTAVTYIRKGKNLFVTVRTCTCSTVLKFLTMNRPQIYASNVLLESKFSVPITCTCHLLFFRLTFCNSVPIRFDLRSLFSLVHNALQP